MRRSIVIVSAGLSVPSSTALLAELLADAVERAVAARGEEVELRRVELRPLAHALTDRLLTGFATDALAEVLDDVVGADALVVATPVFAGSYSGLFKTFFDVLEPGALDGKPVLVAATAGTTRHSLVLDHALRPLFAYLRAMVVPTGVFAASEDFGAADLEGGLRKRADRAAEELVALLQRADQGTAQPSARQVQQSARHLRSAATEVTPFEQLLRESAGDSVR